MSDITGSISTHLGAGQSPFTTAVAVGPLVPTRPIALDYTHFIYTQRYMVDRTSYAAPTASAAHPVITTAYCIGDSNFAEAGEFGDVITFDRAWSTIPANVDDYATMAYQFPGYKFNTGDGFANRGDPRCLAVPVRIAREYFLCATGQTYETPGAIPVVSRQRYILTYGDEGTSDVDYVLYSDFPAFVTAPTADAYQTLVAAGTEIVAEDSYIERYEGAIWCRVTKYIAAR